MAADGAGNLYYVERSRVRKVSVDGTVTTVAGNEDLGYSGDGGPPSTRLSSDLYIAMDGLGNLFIADVWNRRVRVCGPLSNSLFHHRPEESHKPASRIETAYYKADRALQHVLDQLAA